MIPRWIINVYLLWLGCRWLCATPNFTDLLLNSARGPYTGCSEGGFEVALEFIVLLKAKRSQLSSCRVRTRSS